MAEHRRVVEVAVSRLLGRAEAGGGNPGHGRIDPDPAALVEATANLGAANGAAGPGLRPSVLDERRLAGDRLVIEVYCPDQLAAFDAYVDSLDLDPGRTTEQGGEGTDATTGTTTEEDA